MINSRSSTFGRGFTLVELMLVSTISLLLIIVTTTLYAFVATRTSDSISQYNSIYQAEQLLSAIEQTAANSIDCRVSAIGSSSTITCTLPADGTDFNGDGIIDNPSPSRIGKLMKGEYDRGKRVWFYSSDATGKVGSSGTYWFRAMRDDDSTISDADMDRRWSFANGNPRIFIAGTVSFSLTQFMVRIAVNLDRNLTPRERETVLTRQRTGAGMLVVRNVYWRSTP